MKFSHFAGTSLVPLLSRLVLALAFVPAGYNKLMRDKVFSPQQAETLRSLGVSVVEVTPGGGPTAAGHPTIVFARIQDTPEEESGTAETGADQDDGAADADAPATGDEPAPDPAAAPTGPGRSQTPTPAGGEVTAKGVHGITLMCHANNWPMPTLMAYMAGVTELLGGALVLVGFLTRIWALGLAFTMVVAFYFVSVGYNNVFGDNPFDFALEKGPEFNTAIVQLALFVLSFGLVMTGAGAVSLDRMLFGGGRRKKKSELEIEYEDVDRSSRRAL